MKQGQLEFVLDLMEVIDRHRVSVLDRETVLRSLHRIILKPINK